MVSHFNMFHFICKLLLLYIRVYLKSAMHNMSTITVYLNAKVADVDTLTSSGELRG